METKRLFEIIEEVVGAKALMECVQRIEQEQWEAVQSAMDRNLVGLFEPEAVKHWPLSNESRLCFVYFFDCPDLNRVKIGITENPQGRRIDLMRSIGFPLEEIALILGGPQLEKRMHRRFAHNRVGFEWFRRDAHILEFAKQLGVVVEGDNKERYAFLRQAQKAWREARQEDDIRVLKEIDGIIECGASLTE